MKPRHIGAAVALLLLSLLAVADPLPLYTLTQIGPVPLNNGIGTTHVTDLNEKGELAGTVQGVGALHPFFWRSGEMTLLGNNSGTISGALNDRSQVATVLTDATGDHAVLWQRGESRPLGTPTPPLLFTPIDITNSARVLGTVLDPVPFTTEAYLRERTGDFGLLERLHSSGGVQPSRINNRGIAVGLSAVIVDGQQLTESVRWRDGAVERLSMPPGTERDFAVDINERGQIVGETTVNGQTSGYIWHRGQVTLLPVIDPTLDAGTAAIGINNRGWVVGVTNGPIRGQLPTLWVKGVAYDLNTLVSSDDPSQPFVRLMNASYISDSGFIVAIGIDSRGPGVSSPYLLTPIRD